MLSYIARGTAKTFGAAITSHAEAGGARSSYPARQAESAYSRGKIMISRVLDFGRGVADPAGSAHRSCQCTNSVGTPE
jgi:hypothetical protein